MEYNVELAHEFLYDAVIEQDSDSSDDTSDDSSDEYGTVTTEAVSTADEEDDENAYSPSLTVQRISEAIINKTGIYRHEDPEFRGQY
jgi:hypothetical protein